MEGKWKIIGFSILGFHNILFFVLFALMKDLNLRKVTVMIHPSFVKVGSLPALAEG